MRAARAVIGLSVWAAVMGCGTAERAVRDGACSESGAFRLGAEHGRSHQPSRESELDALCAPRDRATARHHYRVGFAASGTSLSPGAGYVCRMEGARSGPAERAATREDAIQAVISRCRAGGFDAFCDANRVRCGPLEER